MKKHMEKIDTEVVIYIIVIVFIIGLICGMALSFWMASYCTDFSLKSMMTSTQFKTMLRFIFETMRIDPI